MDWKVFEEEKEIYSWVFPDTILSYHIYESTDYGSTLRPTL
jgi:hypothetical protein